MISEEHLIMTIHEEPTMPEHGKDSALGKGVASSQAQAPTPTSTVAQPHPRGMSRRKIFGIAAGVASAGAATVVGGLALEKSLPSFASHGATATTTQIGHLLRKAGFGARPDEITAYASLGFDGAVDRLLNYQQVSDSEMEHRLSALNLDLSKPQNQQRWWLLRMTWTQRPLLEKMTLFWHGLLTSSYRKVGGRKAYMRMMVQNQFLREHAFDTFDNILLGITADPAMLVYLDLTRSRKNAPNENYARELMELFTLGLGNYTQQDVYGAAAALTGWHVQGSSPTARFIEQDHSTLPKNYLGHTGNLGYKDVINILTNHAATSWFICRKLFSFFVYEKPSDDDLRPLVETYTKSNHNMAAVMRTLLLSPQFSSPKAYRSRIKSPTEFVVGTYRALNMPGDGSGLPPNVAGWPGDKVSALWLNSGTWMARLNYLDLVLAGSPNGPNKAYQPTDLQGMINANHLDTPERFVDYFVLYLFDGHLGQDRRTQFIDYFKGQENSKSATQITLTSGKSYPLSRVRGTLYLMMASPEYQLN
ncbi:MAG: DUF1800 domain-containing protein [Chloroflexi bacterium]|nr:MAG: DUF1800 domain-containing protein [Chloroflexota bacterium]